MHIAIVSVTRVLLFEFFIENFFHLLVASPNSVTVHEQSKQQQHEEEVNLIILLEFWIINGFFY